MTIVDVIDSTGEQRSLAPLGGVERRWLRFLASQEARYVREQDEAAIEAADYWEQAEEVCSIDPIG
jgi:hypothetical protein